MKTTRIKIPIFDFTVTLVEIESKEDAQEVFKPLRAIKYPDSEIAEISEQVARGCKDGGHCIRNTDMRHIVVVVHECSKASERRQVLAHEFRHVVDRICEHLRIEDIETPAYLAGYLARYFY